MHIIKAADHLNCVPTDCSCYARTCRGAKLSIHTKFCASYFTENIPHHHNIAKYLHFQCDLLDEPIDLRHSP